MLGTWEPAEWLESVVGRGAGDHAHVLTEYGLQREDDFKLLQDEDVEEIHGKLRAAGIAPLHAKAICRAIDAKRQSVNAGLVPITVTSPRALSTAQLRPFLSPFLYEPPEGFWRILKF